MFIMLLFLANSMEIDRLFVFNGVIIEHTDHSEENIPEKEVKEADSHFVQTNFILTFVYSGKSHLTLLENQIRNSFSELILTPPPERA